MKTITTVNIIGLGALGMMYGRNLTEALGTDNVHFVMDEKRLEKASSQTFTVNGEKACFSFVSVSEATPADLVLVAVKYPGLESAIRDMSTSVGDDTVIMSVLNGISSEKIIAETYGNERLIYTVAQGMDATKFGSDLNYSSQGTLFIGYGEGTTGENIKAVEDLLVRANLSCKVEDDIMFRIWSKYMLNVGVNQTCMVYGTTYHGVLHDDEPRMVLISAMREVIAVANAEGINLTEKDLNAYVELLTTLKGDLMPSMAQDRINRKPCEVDAFSGELIRLAKKHGVLVPVNEYLNRRAHEIEKEYIL